MYFTYGREATDYLSRRDKRLGAAIERIGPVYRTVETDVFASIVHHIVGQQISTAAQETIWRRLTERLGVVDADTLLALGREELQGVGISFRKADYILDFARRVQEGSFAVSALAALPDEQVVQALVSLKGVGVWTAEMLLIFCMQRPDVLSCGDLGIRRGLRMLYRHRELDAERLARYRRRYSPWGTVAGLYLWAIAGGALPELTDPARRGTAR